jgi:hypothetical protein
MKKLTLDLPTEVAEALEGEGRRSGKSLGEIVVRLLREALKVERSGIQRNGLAHLAGTWTEEEHAEFEAAIAPMEQIDEELWR